jgi:hypothetical protein
MLPVDRIANFAALVAAGGPGDRADTAVVSGPMMLAQPMPRRSTAEELRQLPGGANMPAIARPADWLDPMHRPGDGGGPPEPPLVVTSAAITHTAIQPTSVLPSASLWPMRSCR